MTRTPRIDLLRGIAIFLVLLLHFTLSYRLDELSIVSLVPESLKHMFLRNGNYGVTIFFVISGYLITKMTRDRWGELSQVNILAFYTQRFARIIPPLLLALGIIVVLGCMGHPSFTNTDADSNYPGSFFIQAAGSVLTFWHNVLMQQLGYFNYALNIYWSLSVEEIFYLAFPLMCLFLKRDRWILLACLALIIIGPIYRWHHSDNDLYFMYGYFACFDAIAIGVGTALLRSKIKQTGWHLIPVQCFAIILMCFTFWQGIFENQTWGFTQIAICTGLLLLFTESDSLKNRQFDGIMARSLQCLGRHSYELYLFHIILLGLMRTAFPRDTMTDSQKIITFLLYMLGSTVIAIIISRYYSEPLNNLLRGRFTHRISRQSKTNQLAEQES